MGTCYNEEHMVLLLLHVVAWSASHCNLPMVGNYTICAAACGL
jgi:hypothetical protein